MVGKSDYICVYMANLNKYARSTMLEGLIWEVWSHMKPVKAAIFEVIKKIQKMHNISDFLPTYDGAGIGFKRVFWVY